MNPIQEKVNALVEEKQQLTNKMKSLETEFEAAKTRIIEINGSINVLVELFQKKEETESSSDSVEAKESTVGVERHDSKSEVKSGSDSNEK